MNQKTLERLTIFNTIMLVILVGKVFFEVDNSDSVAPSLETTPAEKVSLNSASKPKNPAPSGSGAQNYEELLVQTIEPLLKAYSEHSEAPNLPSEEELRLAIETNDVQSTESQKIIEQLQVGYARFNMPFPNLSIPSARATANSSPKKNQASENLLSPNFSEWLRRTEEAIRGTIVDRGESTVGLIPSEQEMQAAIDSKDPLSTESRLVIDMLKNAYARMKVDFPEFGKTQSSTIESSKSMQQKISQKRILTAYFQGQLQRLRLEASAQDTSVDEYLPSEELVTKAIETGTLQSESSKTALGKIEVCYTKLGLTFYRPPTDE